MGVDVSNGEKGQPFLTWTDPSNEMGVELCLVVKGTPTTRLIAGADKTLVTLGCGARVNKHSVFESEDAIALIPETTAAVLSRESLRTGWWIGAKRGGGPVFLVVPCDDGQKLRNHLCVLEPGGESVRLSEGMWFQLLDPTVRGLPKCRKYLVALRSVPTFDTPTLLAEVEPIFSRPEFLPPPEVRARWHARMVSTVEQANKEILRRCKCPVWREEIVEAAVTGKRTASEACL